MPIRLLEPKVISQIAAGEVVERPASVVKELVENALDAGAGNISVTVRGGGVVQIQVSDDGCGIPAAEVTLAFTRHATSKITRTDDLHTVATLGFRGEALPSIASVSDVELLTLARGEAAGSRVEFRDGGPVVHAAGRAPGTTVSVSHLFRQVPARLKFLKSTATENGRISAVVTAYALAHPEVRFSLQVEDRVTLRTGGGGALEAAAADVFGAQLAGEMLPVDGARDDTRVSGVVTSPQVSRGSRAQIYFYVNRRWIQSQALARAVIQAYHGLMHEGRYPVAVLNVEIDPGDVDINIHPTKTEVRFRDEGAVFAAVQSAVRQTVAGEMPVHRLGEASTTYAAPPSPLPGFRPGTRPQPPTAPSPRTDSDTALLMPPPTTPQAALPALRVIGQAIATYIIAEGPDGIYLIDQHAAHERILFEQIGAARAARGVEIQGLLEPETLELSPAEDAVLADNLPSLVEFGFNLEPFGERAYLVRAVPAVLREKDWQTTLRATLDRVAAGDAADWPEHVTATLACHAAVRAGKTLTLEEMRELVRALEQATLPQTCPHGRPTMILLATGRLERDFQRR
jgi:DNA mismatch repair protein MutL